MKWLVVAVTMLACGARPSGAVSGWSLASSNTTANLYGVAYVDANTCVAVGDGGLIVRSTDGGVDWSSVSSPVGDQLRCVSFHGTTGLAVGIAGRIVRSTDGGATWVKGSRPTTKALFSVCWGPTNAVITGEEGTILYSTDGGMTWTLTSAGTGSALFGVGAGGSTVVAAGGAGAVAMSTNEGQGWGLTVIGQPLTFFYGVSFVDATTGWTVGADATSGSIIAKSVTSGFTWTGQTAPTTNSLTGVSFSSLTTGTAVGFSGTIIHTTDGGTHWVLEDSPTVQSLEAVSFLDVNNGLAVGNAGTILRTTTGGVVGIAEGSARRASTLDLSIAPALYRATRLQFSLPEECNVTANVYDACGRLVSTLASGAAMPSGVQSVAFDSRNSGMFLARVTARGTHSAHAYSAEGQFVAVR